MRAETGGAAPLPPEDRALLEDLDLLLDWEMMTQWDPAEDLPIPVESAEAATPSPAGERPGRAPVPSGARKSKSGGRE